MNTWTDRSLMTVGAALLAVSFGGCSAGFNETKVRQAVIDEFKTSEVAKAPGKNYTFIVRATDGSVWVAEVMGVDAKVTAKALMFPAR